MKKLRNQIIFFLAIASLLGTSCEDLWNRCVDGNGDLRVDNRTLEGFEDIEINGDFEVEIDTGDTWGVRIESDENLIDLIVTHVSGNRLIIETRDGICIRPTRPIEIIISVQTVSEITLNGSGYVYSYALENESLILNLAGSGQIEIDNAVCTTAHVGLEGSGLINCNLITESLEAQLEGSGEIKLRGECTTSDQNIIGSGKIKSSELESEECTVRISGSGIADVHVNNTLDVTIIGSGTVYYTGDPTIETYISGSGQVIER